MQNDLLATVGYPLLLISSVEIVLGIILLRHNPRNSPVHRTVAVLSFFTAAFALITGLMYVLASFGRDITFLARANWVGWLMIPAGAQVIFSMKEDDSGAGRIAAYILYPFWIIVLAISVSTDLIESGNYALIPFIDRSGPLGKPLRIIGILQLLWVMVEIYRLRGQVKGIRRVQLKYFTHGLLIFTCGGTLISGVFPLIGGSALEPGLGSYFSLPWIVLTFYAITHYRMFDIRMITARIVNIGVLSLFVALVQIGIFSLIEPFVGAPLAIAASLPVIAFVFSGTTFRLKVQAGTQHLILQDKFDYQQTLKESIKAIITILDLHTLLNYLINSIRKSLGVRKVCLFLKEKDGQYRQQQGIGDLTENCAECLEDGPLLEAISKNRSVIIREELEEQTSNAETERVIACMKERGVEIILPLFYSNQLQGVLAMGEKGKGEPYAPSDIDLLESLAGHAAVAIENARLYDQACHARESHQASETKFQTLADTMPAAIFIHQGGKFLYANRNAESITGYTREEFLGMDFWSVVHPEFREMVRERARSRLSDGPVIPQYEIKIIRKDGAERWVFMTATCFVYEGQNAVIGTIIDITERKALEGRLRYSQKMEAIGKVAGGVAHDFNNIITAIMGYANILAMNAGKNDAQRNLLDKILASTERAANLTQSILAFGKKQAVNLRSVDLNTIVQVMERLLAGLTKEGVELTLRYCEEKLPVRADSSQIERIIMNLLVNARDAMPHGGTVTIETKIAELGSDFINANGYGKEGAYAVIAVRDTGTGMDQAIKDKIFEPFFTTKGLGKGTGFGLSIVYDIVKEHSGYITVDSEVGKGTEFAIYFPLDKEKTAASTSHGRKTENRDGMTILVAEDEDDVRAFIKTVLESDGHRVITASNGEEAIAHATKGEHTIHLMVLDIFMPKINGNVAYDIISMKRPGTQALFTSGYAEDIVLGKGMLQKGQHFLVKPFTPEELRAKVRTVLEPAQNAVC